MDKLQVALLVAPVLLFSMVAHEYAHGYAALKQGDATAYQLGRLSWNPLKHIDPFFTVVMPIVTYYFAGFFFGGAKPVPVNPRNYHHFKRGDIIVSMAGIFVNLCLAVICTLLVIAFGWIGRAVPALETSAALLQAMMFIGVLFNLVLAFFNLLPIPPLDGSHVFKYLLPPGWAIQYQRVGFLGIIVLLALMGPLQKIYIAPVQFMLKISLNVSESSFLPPALDVLRSTRFL
ncbi:MAG TPA: site-2 protease family protein [Gemmatimonadaceae bacterium]|nr:site-2 protease family protein [Gemmatimonadaceae bacterium]